MIELTVLAIDLDLVALFNQIIRAGADHIVPEDLKFVAYLDQHTALTGVVAKTSSNHDITISLGRFDVQDER